MPHGNSKVFNEYRFEGVRLKGHESARRKVELRKRALCPHRCNPLGPPLTRVSERSPTAEIHASQIVAR